MVERINLLLKAKNITARQFAEEIGIQPSGMSHILSGRNNPSLDFVMKVVKRWPEININWLMFGKGEMYVGLPNSTQETHHSQDAQPKTEPIKQDEDSLPEASEPFNTIEPTREHVEEYDLFSQPSPQTVSPLSKPQPVPPVSVPNLDLQTPQTQDVSPQKVSPQVPQAPVYDPVSASPEAEVPPVSLTERPLVAQAGSAPQMASNSPDHPQLHENRPDEPTRPTGLLQPNLAKKKIVKMIVLYDDHSFAEYFPE